MPRIEKPTNQLHKFPNVESYEDITTLKKYLLERFKVVTMTTKYSLQRVASFITKLNGKVIKENGLIKASFDDGSQGIILAAFNNIDEKTLFFVKIDNKKTKYELYQIS